MNGESTPTRRQVWVNTLLLLAIGAVFKLRRGRQRGSPAGGLSKLSSADDGPKALDASRGAKPLMDAGPVDI